MTSVETESHTSAPRTNGTEMIEAYRQMLKSLFWATLIILGALGGGSIAIHYLFMGGADKDPPILLVVALAGTLGALFSSLMRLYNVRELPKALLHPDLRTLRNKYLMMYSLVPMVMGFVAAVVVYLAVLGGIVSGALFPEFTCTRASGDCSSFLGLFDYGPADAPDFAKAIVLGFVSGFSERLFRGILETLEISAK